MRPRTRVFLALTVALALYFTVAYLVMPLWWSRYERRHPALADVPSVTHTGSGIPADPINVMLIGSRSEVMKIMVAARWYPADPLTLKSCLEIAEATVLKRPYDAAPVSNLFLWGRKEDLAFEKPVGDDPRQRHHVRFWESDKKDNDGRPAWLGAAIYDRKVGFSDTTGQITHHTGADIDAERNYLIDDLKMTGDLADVHFEIGFRKVLSGHNGGGDPWFTDGNLAIAVIAPAP
jgi:hypothetical protein